MRIIGEIRSARAPPLPGEPCTPHRRCVLAAHPWMERLISIARRLCVSDTLSLFTGAFGSMLGHSHAAESGFLRFSGCFGCFGSLGGTIGPAVADACAAHVQHECCVRAARV